MLALLGSARSGSDLDLKRVLVEILIVLIAAKLVAELAERIHVPAVLGEIVAGIVIGPSVLRLVDDTGGVLTVLGTLGVILLLLEVGMQTDLGELAQVGRASILVAIVGVVVPFGLGTAATAATGEPSKTAIFMGAAMTATSVGITARVFGDLRALSTVEARTVLGAAVADDVLGLVILTVVVRVVTTGSVTVVLVLETVGLAVGFLVLATVAGLNLAPRLFSLLRRVSRSPGTLVAVALAFTLGLASLAEMAKLAPIIGAFVAGLALARTRDKERIARELTPVGHLFVPVFFLQIGIAADVRSMTRPPVLALAAILFVVAVVGKLAAAAGLIGSPGDWLLVGLGMLPRGEVGLIFASIGLKEGVLGDDLYAALILVVLMTTLITPPLLRARLVRLRARAAAVPAVPTPVPAGGWLTVEGNQVVLRGSPPQHLALHVALEAAMLAADARPGQQLLDWLGSLDPAVSFRWDAAATRALLSLLRSGSARSWKLLDSVGILERALPELAAVIHRRQRDPFELDPYHGLRFSLVDRVQELAEDEAIAEEVAALEHPETLLLAALLVDTAGDAAEEVDGSASPVAVARRLVQRLDLGARAEEEVALLVGGSDLLAAAARRPDGLDEASVLTISSHLERRERARALYLLTLAIGGLEPFERRRIGQLHGLVQEALALPELTSREARNTVEARRLQAERLLDGDAAAVDALAQAPRRWILANDPPALARQARLVTRLTGRKGVEIEVSPTSLPGAWTIDVALIDEYGLLARSAGVMADAGLDVLGAGIAVWGPDHTGTAVQSFTVSADLPPDGSSLAAAVTRSLAEPLPEGSAPDAKITWDDDGSPWLTRLLLSAPDRSGLLADVASALSRAGMQLHASRVLTTPGGLAEDAFELTDKGQKLDAHGRAAVEAALAGRPLAIRRRRPWTRKTTTNTKQSRHATETADP